MEGSINPAVGSLCVEFCTVSIYLPGNQPINQPSSLSLSSRLLSSPTVVLHVTNLQLPLYMVCGGCRENRTTLES